MKKHKPQENPNEKTQTPRKPYFLSFSLYLIGLSCFLGLQHGSYVGLCFEFSACFIAASGSMTWLQVAAGGGFPKRNSKKKEIVVIEIKTHLRRWEVVRHLALKISGPNVLLQSCCSGHWQPWKDHHLFEKELHTF